MNIEKIKNFSQDEQKTLKFFELLRNEIIARDNELNEGIDFIFGRKFATKIDLLLNLVITLEEDKEELQKENENLHKEINQRIKLKIENEKIVDTQFISIKKIKDKIEELKQERTLKYDNYMGYKIESREQQDIDKKVQVLQELLEGDN